MARKAAFTLASLARRAMARRARASLALMRNLARRDASCASFTRLRARLCARFATLTAFRATFIRALAFLSRRFVVRARVRAAARDLFAKGAAPAVLARCDGLFSNLQRGDLVIYQREMKVGSHRTAGKLAFQLGLESRVPIV